MLPRPVSPSFRIVRVLNMESTLEALWKFYILFLLLPTVFHQELSLALEAAVVARQRLCPWAALAEGEVVEGAWCRVSVRSSAFTAPSLSLDNAPRLELSCCLRRVYRVWRGESLRRPLRFGQRSAPRTPEPRTASSLNFTATTAQLTKQ